MASLVSLTITKFLCQSHGSMDFKSLDSIVRQSYTVHRHLLEQVLTDAEKFVIIQNEDEDDVVSILNSNNLIIAKTSLRLCKERAENCDRCQDLHLCRYFVCGECRHGIKCKNSHQLHSAHNTILLTQMGLQHLEEEELFKLLLQNDPYLLPEVCPHYNKGNGEHGSCKFKTSCTNLHVCQHFLQDTCRFGAACKRAHTFDSSTKILAGRGFSQQNISVLHKIYKNRILIADPRMRAAPEKTVTVREHLPRPTSDATDDRICPYHLCKRCIYKERCVYVHCDLPYKWQVLDGDMATWKDLPDGEVIEKAYSDPANDGSTGSLSVDFLSMTCGESSVRRLSTPSSVTKPLTLHLTTEWRWFWRNDQGGWTEYGHGERKEHVAFVTSQTLEKAFIIDASEEMPFNTPDGEFTLSFRGMYQENLASLRRREVRRRPCYVTAQEVGPGGGASRERRQ